MPSHLFPPHHLLIDSFHVFHNSVQQPPPPDRVHDNHGVLAPRIGPRASHLGAVHRHQQVQHIPRAPTILPQPTAKSARLGQCMVDYIRSMHIVHKPTRCRGGHNPSPLRHRGQSPSKRNSTNYIMQKAPPSPHNQSDYFALDAAPSKDVGRGRRGRRWQLSRILRAEPPIGGCSSW